MPRVSSAAAAGKSCALGVALWALLDDAGDPDRADASRVRVERLADRGSRRPSREPTRRGSVGGGVAAIRGERTHGMRRHSA